MAWHVDSVEFQHDSPAHDAELERVFGCPIRFGAKQTQLRFAPAVLEMPHARSDPRLVAVLTRYADSLMSALPNRDDVVASARSAIVRQIATSSPSLEKTAAALNWTDRTLQRRLADSGMTYSGLADDVRRDLALKYIAHAGLSIGEIAYLLRFSDATAFHRAFHRWTGCTPTDYRRRLFPE